MSYRHKVRNVVHSLADLKHRGAAAVSKPIVKGNFYGLIGTFQENRDR